MKWFYSWISEKIVKTSVSYGYGLVAVADITKGERVIVFGGYVITLDQFETLSAKLKEICYQLDDDLFFGLTDSELEPTEYLNHSCEPNCGFSGEVTLVAMRDIRTGEEITMDYAMCTTTKFPDMECLCGSNLCRKTITATDWKRSDLQKRYDGYFVRFLQDKIRKASHG